MVKFTEKQKQYIKDRIVCAQETAKNLMIKYNSDRTSYSLYLLGALESVLADFCDENAYELFSINRD